MRGAWLALIALVSAPAVVAPQQLAPQQHSATCRRHGDVIRWHWRDGVRRGATMRFAPGVRLQIDNRVAVRLPLIDSVHLATVQRDAIVTSARDGKHSRGSWHYCGRALDLRTRDLPRRSIPELAEALRQALGSAWQVIVESTHIHVQLNPQHRKAP